MVSDPDPPGSIILPDPDPNPWNFWWYGFGQPKSWKNIFFSPKNIAFLNIYVYPNWTKFSVKKNVYNAKDIEFGVGGGTEVHSYYQGLHSMLVKTNQDWYKMAYASLCAPRSPYSLANEKTFCKFC